MHTLLLQLARRCTLIVRYLPIYEKEANNPGEGKEEIGPIPTTHRTIHMHSAYDSLLFLPVVVAIITSGAQVLDSKWANVQVRDHHRLKESIDIISHHMKLNYMK